MNGKKYQPETAAKTAYKKHSNFSITPSKLKDNFFSNSPSRSVISTDRLNSAKPSLNLQNRQKENFILNRVEYEILVNQHHLEVQQLLLEIEKLNSNLYEQEKQKQNQIQRVKDQFSSLTHLQISNLRQSQFSQSEFLEMQLRKLKQQLLEKNHLHQGLEEKFEREKEYFEKEQERMKSEMKNLIQKKNNELFELQKLHQSKREQLERKTQEKIDDLKHVCGKEAHQILKSLQEKEKDLLKLKAKSEKNQLDLEESLANVESRKQELEQKYEEELKEKDEKYQQLRDEVATALGESDENSAGTMRILAHIFEGHSQKLIQIIQLKDQENHRTTLHYSNAISCLKNEAKLAEKDKEQLKNLLNQQTQRHMQEIELLKVKMASLHQADLQSLTQLYHHQIRTLTANLQKSDLENASIRALLQQEAVKLYQNKKKYEVSVSDLNCKILKLRMGLVTMENSFKEKIQNEKSLMLLTSRSFIKEVENKNKDVKFQEEELRKLRQLLELERKENQQEEQIVEERIRAAQERLEMLTNSIVAIKKENHLRSEEYQLQITHQNQQITRLNSQLKTIQIPLFDNSSELQQIEHLKEEVNSKAQEICLLKDKAIFLQNRIQDMKVELERYQLEASINQEQAKKLYQQISQNNLQEHLQSNEQQIHSLEKDKEELKKLAASQKEQITELVKKYKSLEGQLQESINFISKRTELQEKVMQLGMDQNLIKNLAEILPRK